MRRNVRPLGGPVQHQTPEIPHRAPERHLGGGVAVAVAVRDVTTGGVHEPVHLALGVMEPSGRPPSVGAGEDRAVAEPCADPVDLGGREIECRVPGHLDEGFGPPAGRVGRQAVAQESRADHRSADAHGVVDSINQPGADHRRCRIFLPGVQVEQAAVADLCEVGAPVACGRNEFGCGSACHECQSPGLGGTGRSRCVTGSRVPVVGWWARLGLNQRPLRCQRSALPLSYAPGLVHCTGGYTEAPAHGKTDRPPASTAPGPNRRTKLPDVPRDPRPDAARDGGAIARSGPARGPWSGGPRRVGGLAGACTRALWTRTVGRGRRRPVPEPRPRRSRDCPAGTPGQ